MTPDRRPSRRPPRPFLHSASTATIPSSQPRLLLEAGGRVPRREGARHGPRDDHGSRQHRRLPRIPRRPSGPAGLHRRRRGVVPLPDADIEVHFGVYDMTERLHRDVQPLRATSSRSSRPSRGRVFFALNHLLHFYRRPGPARGIPAAAGGGPGARGRNGDDAAFAQRAGGTTWPSGSRPVRTNGSSRRRQRCAHAAARRQDVDRGSG